MRNTDSIFLRNTDGIFLLKVLVVHLMELFFRLRINWAGSILERFFLSPKNTKCNGALFLCSKINSNLCFDQFPELAANCEVEADLELSLSHPRTGKKASLVAMNDTEPEPDCIYLDICPAYLYLAPDWHPHQKQKRNFFISFLRKVKNITQSRANIHMSQRTAT